MAGIKDIKFLTRPVQKFRNGGGAAVIPYRPVRSSMNVPNPAPYWKELMASQALLSYPTISAIIKTPEGDVYAPEEEEIRKRQAEDAERAKNTGLVPPKVNVEPSITPLPKPKSLLDDANITVEQPKIDTSSVTPIPEQKTLDDYIITMANNVTDLEKKIDDVNEAKNDSSIIELAEKANKGFHKLSEKEQNQLATEYSEIVFDPAKKKALYEALSARGKLVLSNHAKDKEYITGEELKNLDTEQREYNEKSLKKDQAIVNAYNNLIDWKLSDAGKIDPTGRTLSGQRLLEVMTGGDEYATKLFSERAVRNKTIKFLKEDLEKLGLTDIQAKGTPVKVTEGKSAQQLLQELELSYFPKNFDFISKGALNEEQKLAYDQAVTKVRSAMKEKDSDVKGEIGRAWLRTNVNRMIRNALNNDIPMEQVIEKVNSFNADGIADILIRKEKHNSKVKEWKDLDYDIDFAEIGHIKAAAEDALLSLDLDNLTLQYAKSNRQEDTLRNQIKDVIKNGKNSKYNINDINAQLESLGIKTQVGEDIYGKEINIEDELRLLEQGAGLQEAGIPYAKGGMVGISHLTRPL